MKKLTIMVGAPGSGKTTYAKDLVKKSGNTVIISSDEIRAELFGDEAVQADPTRVFSLAYARANKALANGKDVIFDSTAANPLLRSRVVEACGKNAEAVEFVFIDTPLDVCLKRNKMRSRHVPDNVIRRYIARLIPPTEAEGGSVVRIGS